MLYKVWSKYTNTPFLIASGILQNSFVAYSHVFFNVKNQKSYLFQKERKNGKLVIITFFTPLLFENWCYPSVQEIMGIMRAFLRIRFWLMSKHTIRQL